MLHKREAQGVTMLTKRAGNWIGGFRARLRSPGALLAVAVDATLVGAGLAMAAGAVAFAGLMVAESDHKPDVYGMKYLAIYAQPRKTAKAAGEAGPSSEPPAGGEIDMSPVGSIGTPPPPPTDIGNFALVSARPGVAWLREGTRIVVVRQGDVAPGLGRIVDIVQRDGHWFLIGDSGTALLSREPPTARDGPAREPFNRRMIFGDDK
jgi:hypothetical protein